MQPQQTVFFDELKARIAAALRPLTPKKVILFGSYAWGTPNPDSDIDLHSSFCILSNRLTVLLSDGQTVTPRLLTPEDADRFEQFVDDIYVTVQMIIAKG